MLVLFLQQSLQFTVSYEDCSQFLEEGSVSAGLKRGAVVDSPEDDGQYLRGLGT